MQFSLPCLLLEMIDILQILRGVCKLMISTVPFYPNLNTTIAAYIRGIAACDMIMQCQKLQTTLKRKTWFILSDQDASALEDVVARAAHTSVL